MKQESPTVWTIRVTEVSGQVWHFSHGWPSRTKAERRATLENKGRGTYRRKPGTRFEVVPAPWR
jgi:hypothetical protein